MKTPTANTSSFVQSNVWKYLVIVILAVFQYSQTVDYDYAFDDTIVITKNSKVQKGLKEPLTFFENARTGELESNTGYRPIALLSFATDVHLFGLNPSKAHRTNLMIYTLLCVLLLIVLTLIFPQNAWLIFLVTVLFTVHPLHVEVVANIKSRDELLATLFGLTYLGLHLKFYKTNNYGFLVAAPMVFLLSSMSKENGITFAGISLGLIFLVQSISKKQQIFSAIASVVSIASVLLMRWYVYSDKFFVNKQALLENQGRYHWDEFLGNPLFDVPELGLRIANALNIIYYSVRLFLFPYPLVHDYSYDHFPVVDWTAPSVYVGILIVVTIGTFIVRGMGKSSILSIGALWFIVSISIFLSLVRPATDIFAERFLFSPSIGLCLIFVGVFVTFGLDWKKVTGLVFICSVPLVMVSYQRCPAWENTNSLLEADVDQLADCVRANYNYGLYLHQQYDNVPMNRKPGDQEKILKHYNLAMDRSDRLANLYTALGNAYMRFDQPENGLRIFRQAINKFPDLVKPLVQIGGYYALEQNFDSSEFYFKKALDIGTQNPDLYIKLALAEYNGGKFEEAKQTMLRGEEYSMTVDYYHKFMVVCLKAQDFVTAESVCQRGLAKFPNDVELLDYQDQFLRVGNRD